MARPGEGPGGSSSVPWPVYAVGPTRDTVGQRVGSGEAGGTHRSLMSPACVALAQAPRGSFLDFLPALALVSCLR